jgi:adenylate cyclase
MKKRIPILIGLLLVVFALWLEITPIDSVQHVMGRLENQAYDIQLQAKLLTSHPKQFATSIAIVDINDFSLEKEGRWPWPRSKLAALVEHIQAQGAVVIVFDIIFPQQEANVTDLVSQGLAQQNLMLPELLPLLKKIAPYFDNDAKLATIFSHGDVVVGISFLLASEVVGVIPKPLWMLTTPEEKDLGFFVMDGVLGVNPILEAAAKNVGFINIFPDSDGIIRRVPLLVSYKNGLYPSLALEAVRIYLLSQVKLVTAPYANSIRLEGVQLGQMIIPTDDKGQVIIPFRGRGYTFPYFSATDVLHNKTPAGAFTGKIVFVGATAVGLGDLKATAIQTAFPGIEINATVADGILKNSFPYKPAWSLGAEVFLTCLLGGILLFLFPYLGPRILTLLIILMPATLVFFNNWLSDKTGLVISIFIPLALAVLLALLNIVYGYLFETRRREQLKAMFGQYVPEGHIDEMLKSTSNYALHGEDRNMTVLFADIRNFATISEGMPAAQLKEILNEFFTPMTEIIFKHRGTIDKYVGDLIMAFWGAPLQDKKHVEHGISAALEMQRKLVSLREVFKEKNSPEITIGIGLNSGMMSVGDMGSTFRRNYTVLGDTVNLASRVESLTKYYGVGIIATENTRKNQDKFVFRLLDRVRVKGKKEGVALYQVIGRQAELTDAIRQEMKLSHAALDAYFKQQWDKAHKIFTELNQIYPHIKLYSLYLERLELFAHNPPASDWDGVYTHLKK